MLPAMVWGRKKTQALPAAWRWLTGISFASHSRSRLGGEVVLELPHDLVGLDIGGTLSKIVVAVPEATSSAAKEFIEASDTYGETGMHDVSLALDVPGVGSLYFLAFETQAMEGALSLISKADLLGCSRIPPVISATGGGAHKYAADITEALGMGLAKVDEMHALVQGMAALLSLVPGEGYALQFADPEVDPEAEEDDNVLRILDFVPTRKTTPIEWIPAGPSGSVFPFLLVNIGSGVSVILAESPDKFSRVSGTALGGATFLGLAKLILGVDSFNEALDLAEHGDVTNVNMTVGDIYGGDYVGPDFVLPASLTASCFGKLVARSQSSIDAPSREDLALALLVMISQNVAQLGYLTATRLGITDIFFAGNFLRHEPQRHSPIAQRTLAFFVSLWSSGSMRALFLRHEGYFGAMGALLAQAP